MPTTIGLTQKEAAFVREYLVDNNMTQAAIRAGYSARQAATIGSEVCARPRVAEALRVARARIAEKLDLTAEKVLMDIDRIAGKAEHEGDYGQALRGRELLGKYLRLFVDKVEIDAKLTVKQSAAEFTDDELAAIAIGHAKT